MLHVHHARAGLERQSTAIEGDGFPDKRNGVLPLTIGDMLQDDKSRFFGTPLRHAEQGAKPFLLELGEVKDFAFQPNLICDLDRLVGEHRWGQVVRRLVAQIACEVGSVSQSHHRWQRPLRPSTESLRPSTRKVMESSALTLSSPSVLC